jgi:hypothetical protein
VCFNWAPRREGVLGKWRYSSTHSLTSALDWGVWLASRTGRFIPRERAPGTHWIGGCLGPWAVLDGVVKRKIPSPRRELKPRTPIVQPVAQRYTDWAITVLPKISVYFAIDSVRKLLDTPSYVFPLWFLVVVYYYFTVYHWYVYSWQS